MSTTGRNSHTSRNSHGWWPFRRQPKEPEAAEDLGLPEIAPYCPDRLRNRVILGIVLVVVVVAVAVGVVLSKNGDGDEVALVENRTVAANETSASSSSPATLTERPTASPSSSPATLTERPTASPSTTSIVDEFLNNLPAYSMNLAENDASSPQAKALTWLENDPQYNDYKRVYRLNQRYAMAVLYYSTNGTYWSSNRGWLSDDNECTWYHFNDPGTDDDNSCVEASRLAFLDLFPNDLDGTIPTELELLTDLEYLTLRGNILSGKIPSAL
jgi:hypothetical protein